MLRDISVLQFPVCTCACHTHKCMHAHRLAFWLVFRWHFLALSQLDWSQMGCRTAKGTFSLWGFFIHSAQRYYLNYPGASFQLNIQIKKCGMEIRMHGVKYLNRIDSPALIMSHTSNVLRLSPICLSTPLFSLSLQEWYGPPTSFPFLVPSCC